VSERHPIEVYQTDGEALAAVAALAAMHLGAAAGRGRAVAGLPGGREGHGVLLALAARRDLPWTEVRWFWTDERCVSVHDPQSNVRVARDALLRPRGVPPEHIHPAPVDAGAPVDVARAYAAEVTHRLGSPPVFDLLLLVLGAAGQVAALMPAAAALTAEEPFAPVSVAEVRAEPHVPRVTMTPPVVQAARHVIVAAVGAEVAPAMAAAMRERLAPHERPAQLVRPSVRVTWIADRAAAGELLRDARPSAGQ